MRLMLDTNLVSYLADEQAVANFNRLVRSRGHALVLQPSLLLELAANPNPSVRRSHLAGAVQLFGKRLRSEADLEAGELIEEVRRTHPSWLRRWPDYTKVDRLRRFWTNRLWRQALEDHDVIQQHGTTFTQPISEEISTFKRATGCRY